MSKDDTLFGVECVVSGLTILQAGPRAAHKIVVRELSHAIVGALGEKLGALYEVRATGKLHPRYPAYGHCNYPGYDDDMIYGVELLIMSKEELKAHVDKATEGQRKKYDEAIAAIGAKYKDSVKEEAKRLLEKAAL